MVYDLILFRKTITTIYAVWFTVVRKVFLSCFGLNKCKKLYDISCMI